MGIALVPEHDLDIRRECGSGSLIENTEKDKSQHERDYVELSG
jgi:hypothetical protein